MKTITELSVCALKDALTQGDVSAREAAQGLSFPYRGKG